jgi:hypothetical protein
LGSLRIAGVHLCSGSEVRNPSWRPPGLHTHSSFVRLQDLCPNTTTTVTVTVAPAPPPDDILAPGSMVVLATTTTAATKKQCPSGELPDFKDQVRHLFRQSPIGSI